MSRQALLTLTALVVCLAWLPSASAFGSVSFSCFPSPSLTTTDPTSSQGNIPDAACA